MLRLDVNLNMELEPWSDLLEGVQAGRTRMGDWTRVGILPAGMESGRASVAIVVTLDDGSQVIGQTSLRNFLMAAAAISAAPLTQMEDL